MQKVLLSTLACIISLSSFSQCTSVMAGSYLLNDSLAIAKGYTPTIVHLSTILNRPNDSADFDFDYQRSKYWFDCDNYTLTYTADGGCSYTISGTGKFTPDFNRIDITWNVYYIYTSEIAQTDHDVYTRTPLLSQQQVDSIRKELYPQPVSQKQAKDSTITIKPQTNPVSQYLYFTINANDLPPQADIRIFNLAGQCVYNSNLDVQSGQQVAVNVQNLHQGMYILEATIPKYVINRMKFIKE